MGSAPIMLGKLLLTLLVIVLAAVYVRKRAQWERAREAAERQAGSDSTDNPWQSGHTARQDDDIPRTERGGHAEYRTAAWVMLSLLLALALVLYYFSWQDARTPVTVILHNESADSPVVYQVRKSDLDERSFTTIDGTHVTVSANERMEVVGL